MKYLFLTAVLFLCSNAHADWYLRGTHNGWAATPMVVAGTNTVQVTNVIFASSGSIKFDRFGNWSESYGVGGLNGSNIPVAAGTWNIKFFTDTKKWSITAAILSSSSSARSSSLPASSSIASSSIASSSKASSSIVSSSRVSSSTTSSSRASSVASSISGARYHLRGTHNGWAEGDLFSDVAGSTTDLTICRNFLAVTGGARFKVDPNGGWGTDAFPAADVAASGWTRIVINRSRVVKSVTTKLTENCGIAVASSSVALSSSSVALSSSSVALSSSSIASSSVTLSSSSESGAESSSSLALSSEAASSEAASSEESSAIASSSSSSAVSSSSSSSLLSSSSFSSSLQSSSVSSASSTMATDDFRARTTYFMFVDRFANGDTNNDKGNNSATASTQRASGDFNEWMKYFGGDISGIITKLDYLQSLGVSAIWVTPLVDNIDSGGATQYGAYHGYWARDFYKVDEHLGDWALLDELNVQMEARGMKLILDIALNHSNAMDSYEFGTLLKEGAFVTDFASGKGTWYHNNGAITDCGDQNPSTTCDNEWDITWNVRNKTLYTLADFIQGGSQNSVADKYLIDAALKWMDHGVDGFRIDAIKHIEPGFINRFASAVRAKKPDAYIFGEWYGAGANNTASMTFLNERRGSELLDFNLRDNIENAIAGNQTMTSLSNHIMSRPGKMNGNEDLQSIFLDNHDSTRTSVYLQTTGTTSHGSNGKGMSKAFAEARQNLGMALVMTLPGIPTIYYGSEQNTTWFTSNKKGAVGDDPYNREPMPSFNQTTPAFKMISALANLRKESVAIQRGSYSQRWVNNDVLVFQRQEGSDCAVIAVNRGAQVAIDVSNLCLAAGTYTSKVGSDIVNVASGTTTRFNLSQNEVVVLH